MLKKILVAKNGSNEAYTTLDVGTNIAGKYGVRSLAQRGLANDQLPAVFWRMPGTGHSANKKQAIVAEPVFDRIVKDGPDLSVSKSIGTGPAIRMLVGGVASSTTQPADCLRFTDR